MDSKRESNRIACRKWHAKNRDRVMERQRANRAKNRAARAAYARSNRAKNPHVKLAENIRRRIHDAVKGVGVSARTLTLIGCTTAELQAHLQGLFRPGMSWNNYGPVWHVDHRRPCASFDLTDPAQQRECFHYTNLQPLFARENVVKSATYTDPSSGVTTCFRKPSNQFTT